jgi:hypothetical protein
VTELDSVFHILEERMRGRRVTATRVFLFTLQIYLAADVSDSRDLEIWCEPSWHIRTASGVVTGSGAIEGPSSYADDAEVARASAVTRTGDAERVLVGQCLTGLAMDPATHALTAHFTSGLVAATFSDDPESGTLWVLGDRENNDVIRGTARGIARGSRETRPDHPALLDRD